MTGDEFERQFPPQKCVKSVSRKTLETGLNTAASKKHDNDGIPSRKWRENTNVFFSSTVAFLLFLQKNRGEGLSGVLIPRRKGNGKGRKLAKKKVGIAERQ